MTMLEKIYMEVEINQTLNIQNRPQIYNILQLPLKNKIMIWQEGKEQKWEGLYKNVSKDQCQCHNRNNQWTKDLPDNPSQAISSYDRNRPRNPQ